jgi:hypothetical protein
MPKKTTAQEFAEHIIRMTDLHDQMAKTMEIGAMSLSDNVAQMRGIANAQRLREEAGKARKTARKLLAQEKRKGRVRP